MVEFIARNKTRQQQKNLVATLIDEDKWTRDKASCLTSTSIILEVIHRPYRIAYRVHEAGEVIEILRVWHAARGIPTFDLTKTYKQLKSNDLDTNPGSCLLRFLCLKNLANFPHPE